MTTWWRWTLVAVLATTGCGYHFAGKGAGIPETASSVSVRLFANHTRERALETALKRSIEEEFRRRSALTVLPEPQGDLVVTGVIRSFQTSPVAFTGTSEAVQFQGVIQISFKLLERATGKVVYENPLLQESIDYGATSTVVVTSSPRFQRGTIDARDLANMTNVQISEARKQTSLSELIDLLARDVYLQGMEGF
jgi:hypothetical protein